MNAAVMAVAKSARYYGMSLIGIKRGYNGTLCRSHHIEDDMVELDLDTILDIADQPGTYLRTARCLDFIRPEMRVHAANNIREMGIEGVVVIGGDGSFRALNDFFNDFEVPFAGIPATIDNDIAGTDYCLGVDTAQNVILDCIDSVRDTARSHHRAFVIETMGRDCGYLAMTTALCSAANICIVPEIPYDLESIYKRLQPVINEEGSCIIAVVAEGTRVAQYLTRWLTERAGMDTRLTVLGHVQRGGSPTARDRLMGTRFATRAVEALNNGDINQIMVYHDGQYGYASLDAVAGQQYSVNPDIINLCRELSC